MSDGIFVLNGEQLVELTEQPYETEDVFQALLAKYPNLLAGGQINRSDPRRWLLLSREVAVPCERDGAGRWSLDHLFLDQEAIPTLIEVKRSSDTRIRREVVGQMLDYAANAVAYWPIERLRAEFETDCESRGVDADQEVMALAGPAADADSYWQLAKDNLQQGRVRMVFVADRIPAELQRIVEFLNEQMDRAEVLAVEIKRYVGSDRGIQTLVPRVIGQTIEAEDRKSQVRRSTRQWDEPTFMAAITEKSGAASAAVAKSLLDWAPGHGAQVWWGKGEKQAWYTIYVQVQNQRCHLYSVGDYGRVEIQFQYMTSAPFDQDAARTELLNRLNAVPGVALPADCIKRRPSILLTTFQDAAVLRQFLDVFAWAAEEIGQASLVRG